MRIERTFCLGVIEQDFENVNMLSAGEWVTTDTNAKGLTKTDESRLVYGFVGQGSRARNNTCLRAKRMAKM